MVESTLGTNQLALPTLKQGTAIHAGTANNGTIGTLQLVSELKASAFFSAFLSSIVLMTNVRKDIQQITLGGPTPAEAGQCLSP